MHVIGAFIDDVGTIVTLSERHDVEPREAFVTSRSGSGWTATALQKQRRKELRGGEERSVAGSEEGRNRHVPVECESSFWISHCRQPRNIVRHMELEGADGDEDVLAECHAGGWPCSAVRLVLKMQHVS